MNNITIEYLLEKFPEHENIRKSDVITLLEDIFDNIKFYGEINDKIYYFCHDKFSKEEFENFMEYFYGDRKNLNKYTVKIWLEEVKKKFLQEKGLQRSFEEACEIVTQKWCDMLFNFHLNDNGAINESHGGGFLACALSTVLGEKNKSKISDKQKEKVKKLIYEFYKNHCKIDKDGYVYDCPLGCDYDPNYPLYDILSKAKIDKNIISTICPWKTRIVIDEIDNSVLIYTYQKKEYI